MSSNKITVKRNAEDIRESGSYAKMDEKMEMFQLTSCRSNRAGDSTTLTPRPAPTSVDMSNIHEIFIGFDTYETHPESEVGLPSLETWFHTAKFKPLLINDCTKMALDEALLWRSLNSTRHVLLSGAAGAGKTNLMHRFMEHAKNASFSFALASPTGVAAVNLGPPAETLHRKLSLGLAQEDAATLYRTICGNRKKYVRTWKFLQGTDVLIIDEISMVHREFFTKLEYLFRKARNSEVPFGGVKLILMGDFTQLGPIGDDKGDTRPYVFDADVWSSLKISRLILARSYRQNAGPFLTLLNELRVGILTETGRQLLESRMNINLVVDGVVETEEEKKKTLKLHPLDIYPYKAQVERSNKAHLDELVEEHGAVLHYRAPVLRSQKRENVAVADPADLERARYLTSNEGKKQLEEYFPVFQVNLCEGAQVMMRCNKYIDVGVCNGTLGIVISVDDNFISVAFVVNGKFQSKPMELGRTDFFASVGKTAEIVMTQYPLSLARACTVHKCQGLTLDRVRIDAKSMFCPGQLYVSLSRVREYEHFTLLGFNPKSLLHDPRVVEFENRKFKPQV